MTPSFAFLQAVEQRGQDITAVYNTQGTYDPSTGMVSQTQTTTTAKGYIYDFDITTIDGIRVLVGDRKIALPASSFSEPEVGDYLNDYSVVSVTSVYDGTSVGLYICQVRK